MFLSFSLSLEKLPRSLDRTKFNPDRVGITRREKLSGGKRGIDDQTYANSIVERSSFLDRQTDRQREKWISKSSWRPLLYTVRVRKYYIQGAEDG